MLKRRVWRDGSIFLSTGPFFSLYRHVQSLKSEESIFQHWLAELAQYEFIVIYKKIVENMDVKPNI